MKTIAERTRQVIADNAGCSLEQAADDKHLAADLGLDSLDRYERLNRIQKRNST